MYIFYNIINVKHLLGVGLYFLIINSVFPTNSHMEACANRCAELHCGMTADSKVFHCVRHESNDTIGYIDFKLSDQDKLKLPECYKLVNIPSVKFKALKNKALFDECLRCCRVELLNWCQP